MPHLVTGLYRCEELPSRLLVQSPDGDLTVTDLDLNIKHTRTPPKTPRYVYQTFVYPRRSCSFVPPRTTPARGAVVITLAGSEESMHVELVAVDSDSDEIITELGDCPVSVKQAVRVKIIFSSKRCSW